MDKSAYLKLAPCVIVHSSVGLPPPQIPGLCIFTEEGGPQAGGSPETQNDHCTLLSFSHSLLSPVFTSFFPFSSWLSGLAVLSGLSFNLLIPVTASLSIVFLFSYPPSLLRGPPKQRALGLPY